MDITLLHSAQVWLFWKDLFEILLIKFQCYLFVSNNHEYIYLEFKYSKFS